MSASSFMYGPQVLVEYKGTLVIAGTLKHASQDTFTPFFAKIQSDSSGVSFTGTTSVYQGGDSPQFYGQTGVDLLQIDIYN